LPSAVYSLADGHTLAHSLLALGRLFSVIIDNAQLVAVFTFYSDVSFD